MKLGWLLVALLSAAPAPAAILADHTAAGAVAEIPAAVLQEVRDTYRIFYGHTSHGSQLVTGLGQLAAEDSGRYAPPQIDEFDSDLGHTGSVVWVGQTRDWLAAHPETNMVIWSWCGGCSDNTVAGIDIYLTAMSQLEIDYPAVIFVYMTGHLDGTGVDGILYRCNNQIRDYCALNDKILFDFADIESWDPDGSWYPDETDACGWCAEWCASRDCPSCGTCAHTHCFNCYRKGGALWWLLARTTGWPATPTETRSLGSLKSMYR